MPSITVPPEFFHGELRVYSDWREAFARELLQNAQDAGASRIDVRFTEHDGHGRVEIHDDGTGMDRAVLEEVYFALGRTTKTGADTIGGFGRARIITCFAQAAYRIETRNLVVDGVGGDYTITEVDDYVDGCRFTIDLIDDTAAQVRSAFQQLLATCNLRVPVTIDGARAWPRQLPERASRVMRDADGRAWSRVYVDRNQVGRLLVRVGGLTMFSRYLPGRDDVIVELTASRSREVLSASRDSLSSGFRNQLDEFVSDLTRNRRKALRPETPPLDVHVNGGGFIATDSYTDVEPVSPAATAGAGGADAHTSAAATSGTSVALQPGNAAAAAKATPVARGHGRTSPEIPEAADLGFDVFLLADSADTRVRKLARLWNPSGWDIAVGRRRRALLLAWKGAVEVAVDALVAERPQLRRVCWTVGWTFDEGVEALCRDLGGGHVLALNPVDRDGTTKFKVSDRDSRRRLLALATHEACHVAVDGHDEDFAGLLTDLHARIDPVVADRHMRRVAARA